MQGVPKELPYVDSVCSLGDKLVAVKCVKHGKIIVFKADFPKLKAGETEVKVENLLEFAWSNTDHFHINIGGLTSLGLLGCGDDKGRIWLYKMPHWITSTDESKKPKDLPQKIAPLSSY